MTARTARYPARELSPTALLRQMRRATKTELLGTCLELARIAYAQQPEYPACTGPKQAVQIARPEFSSTPKQERLIGIYLDAQNGALLVETISLGSLNTTRTHPREILRPAIMCSALGFILLHNHPSGCLEPSREDLEFTSAVAKAAQLIGVELFDHLIVTRNAYTSLRERGVL